MLLHSRIPFTSQADPSPVAKCDLWSRSPLTGAAIQSRILPGLQSSLQSARSQPDVERSPSASLVVWIDDPLHNWLPARLETRLPSEQRLISVRPDAMAAAALISPNPAAQSDLAGEWMSPAESAARPREPALSPGAELWHRIQQTALRRDVNIHWKTLTDAQTDASREPLSADQLSLPELSGVPDLGPGEIDLPMSDRKQLYEMISRLAESAPRSGERPDTRVSRTALQAGCLLWQDELDLSHQCSQSIEGEGPERLGDHWHAIMHRREPDYGNSQYWYRRVPRSELFVPLADLAGRLADALADAEVKSWQTRLVKGGHWQPLTFVDCAEAAAGKTAGHPLVRYARLVQALEMQLLLERTAAACGW